MNNSSPPWGPASRRQIDAPKTLADEAYQRIHDDIIRGEFAPNEKLQPDALRERYDIGLSPVREALSRVALEGLAVTEGQRGFFVAPATRQELLDIADLRINFSMMSLERSIRLGDDDWENRVVTTYYQLHKLENLTKREPLTFRDEWERRNRDFHEALESGCGSPWLLHFCAILYDQFERYRRRFVVYTDIQPTIADEHRQIMELALARDTAACKVLKQHFEHAASVIERMMVEAAKAAAPAKKPRGPVKPAAKPRSKVAAKPAGSRIA
ncbi:MAG: FCD domain-containing protein [Xanthobacteraceae bacterium]|nr:FCD domain-containing protein [Xanthobacteraceae bacterium]